MPSYFRTIFISGVSLLSFLSIPAPVFGLEAQILTETEAVQRFERENARIQAIAARTRETRAEARSWSLPSNPAVTYSREEAAGTLESFLTIGQSLPLNGRLGLLRQAGKAAVKAAEAQAGFESFGVLSDFKTAFYRLLLAQEKSSLLDAWIVQFKEVVTLLHRREAEGDISRYDALRAERELADAVSEAAAARVEHIRARSSLASFFGPEGTPPGFAVKGDFKTDGGLPPLETLTARSLSIRGDMLSAGWQADRFDLEGRAARRQAIPEPVLSAGFKRTEIPGLSDSGLTLAVTVPIPLFNAGGTEAGRARAAAERSRAEAAATRRDIEMDVAAAYETFCLRRSLIEDYLRELGGKGTELLQIGRTAYEEGEGGILELLDAYRQSLSSRTQAVVLAWAAKQAAIDLNRIVGEEVLK